MSKRTAFGLPRTKATIQFLRIRKRNRKLVLVLSVFALAIGLLLSAIYVSDPPEKSSEHRQYSECAGVDRYRPSCLRVLDESAKQTKIEISTDSEQKPSSSEEYGPNVFIKDKRDLNAQEGMWRATNLLALYTLIQLLLGAAGLTVIVLTLRQTKNFSRKLEKPRDKPVLLARLLMTLLS